MFLLAIAGQQITLTLESYNNPLFSHDFVGQESEKDPTKQLSFVISHMIVVQWLLWFLSWKLQAPFQVLLGCRTFKMIRSSDGADHQDTYLVTWNSCTMVVEFWKGAHQEVVFRKRVYWETEEEATRLLWPYFTCHAVSPLLSLGYKWITKTSPNSREGKIFPSSCGNTCWKIVTTSNLSQNSSIDFTGVSMMFMA